MPHERWHSQSVKSRRPAEREPRASHRWASATATTSRDRPPAALTAPTPFLAPVEARAEAGRAREQGQHRLAWKAPRGLLTRRRTVQPDLQRLAWRASSQRPPVADSGVIPPSGGNNRPAKTPGKDGSRRRSSLGRNITPCQPVWRPSRLFMPFPLGGRVALSAFPMWCPR